MAGLFRRRERRSGPTSDLTYTYPGRWLFDIGAGQPNTNAGASVNAHTALQMVAVWACISLIADGVASLPIEHLVTMPNGDVRDAPRPVQWLKQPNPFMTSYDFWHRVLVSLLIDGNAFIGTIRNDLGNIVSMFPLPPNLVGVEPQPDGSNLYRYMAEAFDASQILHIPAFTLPGFTRGLSPIEAARQSIGLGLALEEFGARFIGQGTAMAGVIEHPGKPKLDEANALREMFRKTHAGLKNSHAVGILTGGAKWQGVTIPPNDAQFIESRGFQRQEIALLYRIPAYMIDPSNSSVGKNVEEVNRFFIEQTLTPWLVRLEQAFSTFLLPGAQYMRFNLDERLRAKTVERYQAHVLALNNRIMCPDEVRALEGLPPLPNGAGKVFLQPANLIDAVKAKKGLVGPGSTKAPADQLGVSGDPGNPADELGADSVGQPPKAPGDDVAPSDGN